ncbi:DUF3298 domain-containing protein [Sphingobacterium lactis]|uniref:DUF3298 and DUF4163 domain-containing protein n=1 Tax=Sphingobacterium lactis TaxID=797291 RepID=UPI003EC9104C
MLTLTFNTLIKPLGTTFLALALFASCQSNKTDGASKQMVHREPGQDTIVYRDTTLQEFSPYFTEHEGKIDTSYVKVTYPVFQDSNMNKLVQENILFDGEPDIATYMGNFLEGYGNFVEENDINVPLAWFKVTEVSVGTYTPEIMLLKNFTYDFSGGAHGNSFELWNVYDLKNYRKLPLNTFISENKMKEFTKIAEKFFREDEGLTDTTDLEKDYFFEDGIFTLAANYGITKDSIVFHYNPYEIKPYAAGTTTLQIPYEAVMDCMTQTGKNYINEIKKYFTSIQ